MRILGDFSFIPRLAIITLVSLLCLPTDPSSAGTYLLSAHGGSNPSNLSDGSPPTGKGVLRASITNAAGNCAHCHEQHASIDGIEPDPEKPGASNYILFADMAGNTMCNYCHNGSIAAPVDNISSQIAKTYSHDPNYGTGAALCHDCHDSHVAQHTNHSEAAGGNLVAAGSPLLSVTGTSVQNWTAGTPLPPLGGDNLGILSLNAPAEPITHEYELCFKCHAGQLPGAVLNVALQFNPNNYSVHPVATETNPNWNNAFLKGLGFPVAWNGNWASNLNAKMYCSDCHGSETGTDPKGPHGSTIPFMLKAGNTPAGNYDLLCLRCHLDPGGAGNSNWLDLAAWNWWAPANPQTGGPIPPHARPQHRSLAMGGTNAMGCVACHGGGIGGPLASNIHGANYLWPMVGAMNGRGSTQFLLPYSNPPGPFILQNYYNSTNPPFTDTPGNRRCAAACHINDGGVGYLY